MTKSKFVSIIFTAMFITVLFTAKMASASVPKTNYEISPVTGFSTGTFAKQSQNVQRNEIVVADNGEMTPEMLFWQSIKDGDDPASFQAYLNQYPNGHFASLARLKLKGSHASGVTPPNTPPKSNLPNQCDVLAATVLFRKRYKPFKDKG